MLKQSILLLLLINAVFSQELPSDVVDDEKPIIVCKRIVCEDCPESYDTNGCPVCNCTNTDPCKNVNCGSNEKCVLRLDGNGATLPNCEAKAKEPCPIYRCMKECKFGYKKDKTGCPTCECKQHTCDDHKCDEGKVCQPKTVMCFDFPCPKMPSCVWKPLCMKDRDAWLANKGNSHLLSPFLQGHIFADKGASLAQNGGHQFGEDEASLGPNGNGPQKHLLGEDDASRGPVKAEKELIGTDEASKGPSYGQNFPQCDEHGDFLPLQCNVNTHMCWCVDDRGVVNDESLTDMNKTEKKPICPYNRTTAIHGNMKIQHDIEDIAPHLPVIKKVAHNQLSEWLVIDKEFISITEMVPCPIEIHTFSMSFSIFADDKGQNDLAAASFHLKKAAQHHGLSMDYHGHILTPKAESINMHHQFQPLLPEPGIRERITTDYYFTQHRMAILAGLMGITFFLLVLLVLLKMMLAKRRLRTLAVRESGHTYKENLKFAHKFLNKNDVKEDKLGPLTELEAGNDSVA